MKTPLRRHSRCSPATAAVKTEGKWTPFRLRRLQTSCKLVCRDEGSKRCRTSSDAFNSWRRKAALVNRPHRVLWRRGSMRRASQAGVSVSAGEKINNHIVAQMIQTFHINSSNTNAYIQTDKLMWHLAAVLCRPQGCLTPVQHSPLPRRAGSVPDQRIESIYQPSGAGKAAHVPTSQRALQTRWPHPARTDWSTWITRQ